jgi:tetratricopeptide (TPR) repeat protein
LDKAIEIKRRAQRCIQNGDLDGALSEYEKLVAIEDSDPYNFVLLADLMFKKGDTSGAGQRYLGAAAAYEKAGLYKNAIAVCKKLMRLQLAPLQVYQRLAVLHSLDGLGAESSMYYQQHAEHLVREKKYPEAAESLRLAFEVSNENIKALEKLSEAHLLIDKKDEAVRALVRAVQEYTRTGLMADAERCRKRARTLDPAVSFDEPVEDTASAAPVASAGPSLEDAFTRAPAPAPPGLRSELVAAGDMTAEPAASTPSIENDPDFMPTSKVARPARPAASPAEEVEAVEIVEPEIAEPEVAEVEMVVPEIAEAPSEPEPPVARPVAKAAPVLKPAAPAPRPATPAAPVAKPAASVAKPQSLPKSPPKLEPAPVHEVEAAEPAEAMEESAEAISDIREEPLERFMPPASQAPAEVSPSTPGLRFPVAGAPRGAAPSLTEVERMLSKAQDCFRAGQREAASEALAGAARAYDELGRFDSAATIYRSLGKSAHATTEMLELWLENCERRQDGIEASQVACELGDRSLNEGNTSDARTWFERARDYDASNEVSLRRLQRLGAPVASAPAAPVVEAPAPAPVPAAAVARTAPVRSAPPAAPPDNNEGGRVEVAVGRGEAVTFDLGSLISEFQRGVETQLSGDAQGHYDLGMSYREMGLLEQAVDSFRIAAEDPALGLRALEMIGRCLLDQGQFDDAIQEFERALEHPEVDDDARLGLRYEMGMAHEAAGRPREALAEFELVHAAQADYPDIELKIRVLRKTLGTA